MQNICVKVDRKVIPIKKFPNWTLKTLKKLQKTRIKIISAGTKYICIVRMIFKMKIYTIKIWV